MSKRKKKGPRKARCVRCKTRIWFAPANEGSKSGRPICDQCRYEGCVGQTLLAPMTQAQIDSASYGVPCAGPFLPQYVTLPIETKKPDVIQVFRW